LVMDRTVAVEWVADLCLRGRPVIVVAPQTARSLVYDLSEKAFQAGVRKGMALRRARLLCPEAYVVAPRRTSSSGQSGPWPGTSGHTRH